MLFRYLLFAAAVYLVYRIFKHVNTGEGHDMAETSAGADMIKDPNCNAYIPMDSAVQGNIKGEVHYFCSRECKEEFLKKSVVGAG